MIRPLVDDGAERAVLGAVLLSPPAYDLAVEAGLTADAFHDPKHSRVWSAFADLVAAGRPLDLVGLTGRIEERGPLDLVGGYTYLAGLGAACPSTAAAGEYARTVLRTARLRRLKELGEELAVAVQSGDAAWQDIMERHEEALTALRGSARPLYADRWRTVGEWGGDDPGAWLNVEPPPRPYLLSAPPSEGEGGWPGLLPLGKVAMLAGAGGVGKTMALCQLAVAVAAGVRCGTGSGPRWLDTYRVDAPGRVALLTGEEDAPELRRRLFNAAGLMRLDAAARDRVRLNLVAVPLTGLDVALLRTGADGVTVQTDAARALRRRLDGVNDGRGWSLVILDPMSRFEPAGAEVDNVVATRFVTACERLTEAPGGPAVLLSHHTSQAARKEGDAGATAARGVTGLTDAVRAVFLLQPVMVGRFPVPNLAELTMNKSNYGTWPPPLVLTRVRDLGGGLRPAGDDDRAELRRMEAEAEEAKKEELVTAARRRREAREADAKEAAGAAKKAAAADSGRPPPGQR